VPEPLRSETARRLGYRRAGEVAELLGVTVRTVHYYEEEGLVTPLRTARGTRYYSGFDVRRLEVCVRLACVGVPLRTVRDVALSRADARTGEEFGRALVEVIAAMRTDFRANLSTLRSLLADLERAERLARSCWSCPNRPTRRSCPDCPCETGLESSFFMHLAWDPDRPRDSGPETCS
jgi:DNA-binding transcriptional MerR regulator